MKPRSKLLAMAAVALAAAPHLPVGYFDPLERPTRPWKSAPTLEDLGRISAAEAKRARRAARPLRGAP